MKTRKSLALLLAAALMLSLFAGCASTPPAETPETPSAGDAQTTEAPETPAAPEEPAAPAEPEGPVDLSAYKHVWVYAEQRAGKLMNVEGGLLRNIVSTSLEHMHRERMNMSTFRSISARQTLIGWISYSVLQFLMTTTSACREISGRLFRCSCMLADCV